MNRVSEQPPRPSPGLGPGAAHLCRPIHGALIGTRRSLVATEAIIAAGLTVALIGLFAVATLQYAAVRKENDTRTILRLIAAAELERMRAGVINLAAEPQTRPPAPADPAGVSMTVAATPGEGTWKGLTRVRVVASKQVSNRRQIEIEVVGYITPPEAAP